MSGVAFRRNGEAGHSERLPVSPCDRATALGPAGKKWKSGAENRGLQLVETTVYPRFLMVVARCLAAVAQPLDPRRQRGIIRRNRAAVAKRAENGIKVITVPETRWSRRDIKSVNLLPNVLARQQAKEAGAFEAWFVDQKGMVTEGTSSNAFIVDAEGRIRTRALSADILHGVTRAVLLKIARERQMTVSETPFSSISAPGGVTRSANAS